MTVEGERGLKIRLETIAGFDDCCFRGSKLVYDKRTSQPGITVPTTWTSRGHLVHLGPGSYRWYVWAGLGRRAAARYARLGTAAFTVVRSVA